MALTTQSFLSSHSPFEAKTPKTFDLFNHEQGLTSDDLIHFSSCGWQPKAEQLFKRLAPSERRRIRADQIQIQMERIQMDSFLNFLMFLASF